MSLVLLLTFACGDEDKTTVSLRVYPAEGLMHDNILSDGTATFMEVVLEGGERPYVQRFPMNGSSGKLVDIPVGANLKLTTRGYVSNPDGSESLVFYGGSAQFSVSDGAPVLMSIQVGRSDCVAYNRPSVYRAQEGKADLLEKRIGMSVTKLADGRVMIAGGAELGPDGTVIAIHDSVEFFDPVQSQFISAPFRLNQPRAFHTATRLPSGGVLVAGGITAAPGILTETVSIIQPENGPFYVGPVNAAGFEARSGHTARRLNDGSVLIVGGTNSAGQALASSFRFFPTDQSFRAQGEMAEARTGHGLSEIERGAELAIVGGGQNSGGVSRTVEIFTTNPNQVGCAGGATPDPNFGCWISLGTQLELPEATWGHSAVAINGGREVVFVGGYTSADRTQPSNRVTVIPAELNAVIEAGILSVGRGEVSATAAFDGTSTYILVAGGRNGDAPQQAMVRLVRQEANTVIQYVEEALTTGCVQAGVFPEARWGAKGVLLENGTLLVLGGGNRSVNGYDATRRAEVYFPQKVSTIAP
jgi:hypothetical protein